MQLAAEAGSRPERSPPRASRRRSGRTPPPARAARSRAAPRRARASRPGAPAARRRVASRSWRTSVTRSVPVDGDDRRPRPGCSTISRSCSPQRSTRHGEQLALRRRSRLVRLHREQLARADVRRRRPRRRTPDRRPGRGPCARAAARRRPRCQPSPSASPATRPRRGRGRARPACGARGPGGARADRPPRRARRSTGRPPSADRGVRGGGGGEPAVAERAMPVPTMPGPIAQTATSTPRAFAHASADHGDDALDVAAEARATVATRLDQRRAPSARARCRTARPAALRRRAGRRRRGARRAPRTPARPGCAASSTPPACPSSDVRERRRPPRRAARRPGRGVYGSFITCAPGLRGEPEAAGQVRVQDVEAARAEPEVARLRVDDHLVAERDRPGQPRVGDARARRPPRPARAPRGARAPR